ncbi:unnamed protein product [Nezara viridula]|uniref:OBP47-like domain-containing protein n=1 Tax=Nezara viridula TaxID=85310 RepID=A0A9P0GX01_NEZVI|nr:unnamed protein product [Nezara viridula]
MERLAGVVFLMILTVTMVQGAPEDYNECRNFVEKGLPDCCKRPEEGKKASAETVAIKKKCDQAVMGNRQMPAKSEDRMSIYECLDECYYNATKQFLDDLKPNEDAMIEAFLEGLESYPQWKETVVKSVKNCVKSDYVSRLRKGAKCKSGVLELETCLGKQMYLNCPEDAWQSNRLECSNAKEIYVKCTPDI